MPEETEQVGPIAEFSVNTLPLLQTWRQPTPGAVPFYSGKFLFEPVDFGIVAVNTDNGVSHKLYGVSKNQLIPPSYRYWPPAVAGVEITGDCWQSVGACAATPGTPKWVVAPNTATMCEFKNPFDGDTDAWGLQVWKYNGLQFVFYGFLRGRCNGEVRLDGDTAFCRQPGSTPKWMQFDLATMTKVAEDLPDAPPFTPQLDVDGFTYNLEFFKSLETLPSPNMMLGTRQGGTVLPTFCPVDVQLRQQTAAMIYNAIVYMCNRVGIAPPTVPTEAQFSDVPMEDIFAPPINTLHSIGIVAGKPECECS